MPTTVCRSVPYQTTLGIEVFIQKAPTIPVGGIQISQHTLPDYQITLAAAIVAGIDVASLQLTNPPAGVTAVYLDAGVTLQFPPATAGGPTRNITIAEGTIVTATAVNVPIIDATVAIPTALVAPNKALLSLPGCRSAIVTPTIKSEDVTNYLSGIGMEMLVTGNSKKVSMELDLVYNSIAHDIILDMSYDYDNVGREGYLDILFPSGERHRGYALMTTSTPAGQVQAKRSMTLEWQFQGSCYEYISAPIANVPVAGNIYA
jgi:hypothetical protein